MTIRLMAWNIQNFGTVTQTYADHKGDNSALLVDFIRGVIRLYQIDVLVIMEVSQDAQPSLNALLASLNRGLNPQEWCYDWVRGCVAQPQVSTPPQNINSPADLDWTGSTISYRAEGYAVFWKNEQRAARFTMLGAAQNMSEGVSKLPAYNPAYIPTNCISLSLGGRNYRQVGPPPYVQTEFGFLTNAPNANWIYSQYPDVSRFANPYDQRWERVRRPAWIAIQIVAGGGAANTVIPFVVYHAPSNRQLSRTGVYLNGLAQELYVLKGINNNIPNGALFYHRKAVAAGDYNLETRPGTTDDWSGSYRTFYRPFGNNFDTGANMQALSTDTHFSRTTVQVNQFQFGSPTGPPIQDDDVNAYYHSVIDNLFYRNLTNANVHAVPLLETVMNNGAFTRALVRNFYNHINKWRRIALDRGGDVDNMLGPRLPVRRKGLVPKFPHMINWQYFIRGLHRGYFSGDWNSDTGGARSAATFIHDFISDHLPVYVEFDIA